MNDETRILILTYIIERSYTIICRDTTRLINDKVWDEIMNIYPSFLQGRYMERLYIHHED
jgi:hypothetical protein